MIYNINKKVVSPSLLFFEYKRHNTIEEKMVHKISNLLIKIMLSIQIPAQRKYTNTPEKNTQTPLNRVNQPPCPILLYIHKWCSKFKIDKFKITLKPARTIKRK